MKLEIGKTYLTKSNQQVKIIGKNETAGVGMYPFKGILPTGKVSYWKEDGSFLNVEHPQDLIALLDPTYYEPFTWEDRAVLRSKWVVNTQSKEECKPIKLVQKNSTGLEIWLGDTIVSAEELLTNYTFTDGLPCGKEKPKRQ